MRPFMYCTGLYKDIAFLKVIQGSERGFIKKIYTKIL